MRLRDKVAIITGSNDGIGKETALLFSREGAKVTIVGRREKEGLEVVDEIRKERGRAIFVKTDISRETDVSNMVAETIGEFGKLDILVNNAAVQWLGTVLSAKP
jgi:NAD(P)-dependent dehydrogenase (short-subunit alcohol dehydrogenase family)